MTQKRKNKAYIGIIQEILNSCQICGGKLGEYTDYCDKCVKEIEGNE